MRRYELTEESYRQRFRSGRRGKEEFNRELVALLEDLATKWLKSKQSRDEVVDMIVLEQFLETLPDDVKVFVRERSPGTIKEAARLADDYLQARREDQANKDLSRRDGDKSNGRRCLRCGRLGHLVKDCRISLEQPPKQDSSSRVAERSIGG